MGYEPYRSLVGWLEDATPFTLYIDDVPIKGCYLRECNLNLADRELYVQIYTPFPAQEVRQWFGV